MNTPAKEIKLMTFYIDRTVCAMDILDIQEITKVSGITSTPRSPEFVEGIINLRGNIVTIVNLGKKLGLQPVEKKKENHVIITLDKDEHIGLMIHGINKVIHTKSDDIEPVPSNMDGIQSDYFEGIFKTDDQLIGILGTRKVLAA